MGHTVPMRHLFLGEDTTSEGPLDEKPLTLTSQQWGGAQLRSVRPFGASRGWSTTIF